MDLSYIGAESVLSLDRWNAADSPAATSGPAVCGSCRLGVEDWEAVVTAQVCEQEKQVKMRVVCHPAVNVRKVTSSACHMGGNALRVKTLTQPAELRVTCKQTQRAQAYRYVACIKINKLNHFSSVKQTGCGIGVISALILLFRGGFYFLHSCGKLAEELMSVWNAVQWLWWQLYAWKKWAI